MKPVVKILIRQNIFYIVLLVILAVGSVFAYGYLFNLYTQTREQIAQTRTEIADLTQRRTVLRALAGSNSQEITDNLEIMNSLIPNSEDYFSIIYALDLLSQRTGFIINSYTVDLTASKQNRLALSVSGIGDPQSFLRFLNDYNTGGGRLITAETVQLDSANSGSIRLQLYFYNKSASADDSGDPAQYERALAQFEKIRSKVSIAITDEAQAIQTIEDNYRQKSNPF